MGLGRNTTHRRQADVRLSLHFQSQAGGHRWDGRPCFMNFVDHVSPPELVTGERWRHLAGTPSPGQWAWGPGTGQGGRQGRCTEHPRAGPSVTVTALLFLMGPAPGQGR